MEKILLVEDSKPTIELINTALTDRGYKVAFALNGN
jgi:CheY-like chemotaxis protein